MTRLPILTIGPNGGVVTYASVRATARALGGTGSESLKSTISSSVAGGGGYVGNVYVANGTSFVRP